MDVLFLCTGNICRSPMAEGLLRQRLEARGVPARVHSAGLVLDGEPASAHGVELLRARGVDLSNHRSRIVAGGLLRGADLIIGMAREHVREAVVAAPEVFPRAFTLKELVRRGREAGVRPTHVPLDAWLDKVHAGRHTTDLLGHHPDDDIYDPIGQTRAVYEAVLAEIDDLIGQLCDLAFPPGGSA